MKISVKDKINDSVKDDKNSLDKENEKDRFNDAKDSIDDRLKSSDNDNKLIQEIHEEKKESKWDNIDWNKDLSDEKKESKWDNIAWNKDISEEKKESQWDKIDWNKDYSKNGKITENINEHLENNIMSGEDCDENLNDLKDFEEKIEDKDVDEGFVEKIEDELNNHEIEKDFIENLEDDLENSEIEKDFLDGIDTLETNNSDHDFVDDIEDKLEDSDLINNFIEGIKEVLNIKDIDKELIDNLIKSLESKEMSSPSEITQKKLIANQQKFFRLKEVVIEQIREFGATQQKKYRISEIINKIGYKYNDTRVRNTIKDLIGEILFPIFFGGEFGQKAKYKLEDVYQLADNIGRERYGTPGIVTSRGVKLFLKDINSGISPSLARTEIWCQKENHPPFTPLIYKLSLERSWCKLCWADARMKSYDDVLMIGAENGYILDETTKAFIEKMKIRGNKSPKDVRLNWICTRCDTPKNYSYNNIQKITKDGATGCKTCFSKSLEITKDYVQKVGKEKGIELDMTDEEFEIAKEKMKEQKRPPAHARLIWKIRGKRVPLTFNYVAYLMNNKARYKNIDYISPTGHRSSEGENHGRWVLQKMFGAKFEHTFFKDIVGEELEIPGQKVKIHPRSHVDGYDIVHVKGKDFKTVYEFWEMYHHKKPGSKKKDEFKRTACNTKEIIFIVLTDEQNPVDFQQIIARQFTKQTGIIIQHQYQKKLDSFLKTLKKQKKNN